MKRTSSRYNRFLLSTCLPVVAITLCHVPVAHAGFEWTPPPKVEPAPLPPVETKDAVMPEAVEAETLGEQATPTDLTETPEPAIEIKVLDDTDTELQDEAVSVEIEKTTEVKEEPVVSETADVLPEPEMPVTLTEQGEAVLVEEEVVSEKDIIEIEVEVQEEPVQEITVTVEEPEAPAEEVVETVIEEVQEEPVQETDTDKAETSLTINPYPLEEAEAPAAEAQEQSVKETIYWNAPETFETIEGFGADMPLALALRQIVPASYAFSFGEGINPGTKISWDGGKPWNEVLEGALTPLGLAFDIKGNKLLLRRVPMKAAEASVDTPASAEGQAEEIAVTKQASQNQDLDEVIDEVIQAEAEKAEMPVESASNEEGDAVIEIVEPVENVPEIVHQQAEDVSAPAPEIAAQEEAIEAVEDNAGLQPVEIVEEQEEAIPAPDYKALSEPLEAPAEEAVVQRKAILDPGQTEGQQPVAEQSPEAPELLDEKKNERIANTSVEEAIEVSSVDPVSSVSETVTTDDMQSPAEALEEIIPSSAPEAHTPSPYRISPSNEVKVWDVKSGANLRDVLTQWAQDENIQMIWEANGEYEVSTTLFINGTFENAIEVLLSKGIATPPNYNIVTNGAYQIRVID